MCFFVCCVSRCDHSQPHHYFAVWCDLHELSIIIIIIIIVFIIIITTIIIIISTIGILGFSISISIRIRKRIRISIIIRPEVRAR